MDFQQFDLGQRQAGEVVEITLKGTAASVELLDVANLAAFKAGRRHRYYGGLVSRSPIRLQVPAPGHWYLVVHLGGAAGRVSSSVVVLPA